MNINCAINCKYQKDGKCTLIEPKLIVKQQIEDNPQCPYFENLQK